MSLNWFIVTLVFYGFSIGLKYLDVNLYMIGLVAGTAEFLGSSSSYFCASKCGRKWGLIFAQFISALASFLYLLASGSEWKVSVCLLFGVMGNTAAFNIIYLITSELFPTSFRATVFGMTNFVARLGGVVAPLIDEYLRGSYMLVFGATSLFSCLISLTLRETKGLELQD